MWLSYNTQGLKDKYLFKFLPKKYLLDFIENNNIWFSRADYFGDKMECVHISDLLSGAPDHKEINERKKKYLISCWHSANKESIAFWDTYHNNTSERRTTAIRFRRSRLLELMREWFFNNNRFYYETKWIHGQVKYLDLIDTDNEKLNQHKIKFPAFRKERAFSYENEYRFVIGLQGTHGDPGYGYHLGSLKPSDYEIIVNPLLPKEEYTEIKNELEAMQISNVTPSVLTKWLRPEEW